MDLASEQRKAPSRDRAGSGLPGWPMAMGGGANAAWLDAVEDQSICSQQPEHVFIGMLKSGSAPNPGHRVPCACLALLMAYGSRNPSELALTSAEVTLA